MQRHRAAQRMTHIHHALQAQRTRCFDENRSLGTIVVVVIDRFIGESVARHVDGDDVAGLREARCEFTEALQGIAEAVDEQ